MTGSPPARRWVLALPLCFAVGLLLAIPGTARGISGYASGASAAAAQYPDSSLAQSGGPKPVVSNLADVMKEARNLRLSVVGQASQQAVVHSEIEALAGGAGADLAQKGSIALLLAAIAVVLVGGVLRWRRGGARTE